MSKTDGQLGSKTDGQLGSKTDGQLGSKTTGMSPIWGKTVILIYPFEVKELDLQFDLQIPTILYTDDMDEFIEKVHDVGSYYGARSTFTDDEIKQLKEIYENLCEELENINLCEKLETTDSNNKSKQKKLQKQIQHFKKHCINKEEGKIRRWFFTDANFPMFKKLEKIDEGVYKILSYST